MRERPLIYLDVDGPLIPFRERPGAPHGAPPADPSGHPLIHRLDPGVGARLAGLGGELVWATTWMGTANEIVAPRLGLPDLPVVPFPAECPVVGGGLHWKTIPLVNWAGGRPFVWLDDEVTKVEAGWVDDYYPSRALVHRVDPFSGLTDADFVCVERWLRESDRTG